MTDLETRVIAHRPHVWEHATGPLPSNGFNGTLAMSRLEQPLPCSSPCVGLLPFAPFHWRPPMHSSRVTLLVSFILFTIAFAGSAVAQSIVPDGLAVVPAIATRAGPGSGATDFAAASCLRYSDGYRMRAKIHKISSFATIPLFVTEAILGQSLYSDTTSGKKDAHLIVAGGIGALFAVNTTTGVWNLIEARKDPNHRTGVCCTGC